jgi:Tol biopolymer transport system component
MFGGDVGDLFVVTASGDHPKQLTFGNSGGSPAWTQNGEEIVFTSAKGGLRSLWRIPVSGGTPRAVAGVGEMAISPSISPKGNQLAYQHIIRTDNIWRLDLKDSKHSFGSPVPIFW